MSEAGLAVVETLKAEVVFAPGGVDAVLEKIFAEVRASKTDISTKAGRMAVASLAHKVARSKTALDELGKNLVADLKKTTNAIDADRRLLRDKLDALKDEVRKPLTDWEDAEKARVEGHEKAIGDIRAMASFDVAEPSSTQVSARISALDGLPVREWHEFSQVASEVKAAIKASLNASLEAAIRRETERAELARLQKEAAEREQRDRDERLRAEAAEKARLAAEAEAKEAARAAFEASERERLKVEREKQEAEAAAKRAEADRIAAQEKARVDAEELAAKVEADRIAAAEQAERDRAAAIEAERKRVADEKAALDAETAKREANKKHRAKINNEVLAALVALGLTEEQGTTVVTELAKGNIPHTRIAY
jgi:colicin import membrane protein